LDPYGRGVVVPPNYSRQAAVQPGENTATAMKSVLADPSAYDWEGDVPLHRPASRTIIYEMHVSGFTRHHSSGVAVAKRGTYAGLVEKIPYLQDLGSRQLNCCLCSSSTPRIVRRAASTTGVMRRFPSSRRRRRAKPR